MSGPASAAEVAAAIATGGPFVPRGGGTKQTWGLATSGTPLELGGLDAVVAIDAGDLVCVVQAGVRLRDLQERLAAHRLALMIDPDDGVEATVGGVVAGNACGPLRHRYGSPRDLVLGTQVVLADGTIARSGGRVVKNVAGYDIARLLAGSLGTLAILCEAAFRLHPAPPARLAVVWQVDDAAEAAAIARTLDAAPTRVETIEVAWPERLAWTTVAGSDEVVREQARALCARIPGGSVEPSAPTLEPLRRLPGALLGFGVPTSATATLLELAERTGTHVRLRAGIGVGDARTDADAAFASGVRALGGHVAPRRSTGVGYDRDAIALELMRAVKRRLDPDDRLSPGRLWEAT